MKSKGLSILILVIASSLFNQCVKTDAPVLPLVSVAGATQERKVTVSEFEFNVSLDKAVTSDASFDYATSSGTAEADKDFTSSSGTLIIPAGKQSTSIKIHVKGDSTRKVNQTFFLDISNPKNCSLVTNRLLGTIVNENGSYLPIDNGGFSTPKAYAGYTLIWSDEFDKTSVNTDNWTYESGNNNGWGNHELENYTGRTQNSFVSQGNLIIEARPESFGGSNYTSARMVTKEKKTFKFGRVDIRAKLPKGKGIWPALWMLGNNIDEAGWPTCGEIDIMELVGNESGKVYGTLHWGPVHQSAGGNYSLPSGIFNDEFHVFSLVWDVGSIKLYIDNLLYFTHDISGSNSPFARNFFFIFNVAVGGDWPGAPDGTTPFPQRMVVDYIRVFQ